MRLALIMVATPICGFGFAQTPTPFPALLWSTGERATDVSLGDLNHDGHCDAIVATNFGFEVLRGDGSGALTKALTIDLIQPRSHELVDIDRDGWLDLVVRGANSLVFAQGLRGGGFAPAIPLAAGDFAGLALADFDHNGGTDVVAWSSSAHVGRVFLWQGTGFAPGATIALNGAEGSALQGGDFDGDGHPDVALVNHGTTPDTVLVARGDGTGGFANRLAFDAPGAESLVATDVDGDGVNELSTVDPSGIRVYGYVGQGRFAANAIPDSENSGWVSFRDQDADGDPDLILSRFLDDVAAWYRNDGSGGFVEAGSVWLECGAREPAFADLDEDGWSDLVAVVDGAMMDGWLNVTLSGTGGYLRGPTTTQLPRQNPFGTTDSIDAIVAADIDGDGDLDVVCSIGSTLESYSGNGQGGFDQRSRTSLFARARWLRLADFDGDGDQDVMGRDFADVFFSCENDGTGRFANLATPSSPMDYDTLGDFDGDGRIDALELGPGVRLFRGDGASGFLPPISSPLVFPYSEWAVGDVNGDGRDDIVAGEGSVATLLGTTSGVFAPPIVTYIPGHFVERPVLGDLDGDGRADIAWIGSNSGKLARALGDGSGRFLFPAATSLQLLGSPPRLSVTRLDANGRDDLIVHFDRWSTFGHGAIVELYVSGPNGIPSDPRRLVAPSHLDRFVTGDFDGDSRSDFLIEVGATKRPSLLLQR